MYSQMDRETVALKQEKLNILPSDCFIEQLFKELLGTEAVFHLVFRCASEAFKVVQ